MTTPTDELRVIADAATKGEWTKSGSRVTCEGWYIAGDVSPTNARHIATFDPPTILALLDRLAALEAERAADKARIEELVEALKCADALLRGVNMNVGVVERKIAAALEHGGAGEVSVDRLAAEPELTMRYVEFDPLGWQLWSADKGFQIAGFAHRDELTLYLDARKRRNREYSKP